MDVFCELVRNSKIPHPNQKTFSTAKWTDEFNKIHDASEQDKKLFHAGMWVFAKLELIRHKRETIHFNLNSKEKIIRQLCGVANRTAHILSQNKIPLIAKDIFIAEQLIQNTSPGNVLNPQANPDSLLTAEIDALRYPLTSAYTDTDLIKQTGRANDVSIINEIRHLLLLGQAYDTFEGIWLDCLWRNKFIEAIEGCDVIKDSSPLQATNYAISDYRRQSLLLQFNIRAINQWKHKLSDEVKRELSTRHVVKIVGSGKERRLTLSSNEYNPNFPPVAILNRIVAQEAYFKDLQHAKLPFFHNLSLELLLSAWELLHSIASELMARFPSDSSVYTLGKMYQYAPSINKRQLIQIYAKALGITRELAAQVVELLIFKPTPRCQLWFHPLIDAGHEKLIPLVTPILYGNQLRNIEYWLKTGGAKISVKGSSFEKEIREDLVEFLKIQNKKRNIEVNPKSLKIILDSKEEEIDIVIRIGNTILLGEAKCHLFPTEALDDHHYNETIKEAAIQIKRKKDYVEENIAEFLKKANFEVKLDVQSLKFTPFILSNLAYGAGFSVNNIPIIDKYLLERYLVDGSYDMLAFFEQDGTLKVGKKVLFYTSDDEAEKKAEEYLNNPPQLNILKNNIKVKFYPIPMLDKSDKPSGYASVIVELPFPNNYVDSK